MKCRLCDRPTAAGTGKLCADCAKALRRARGAAIAKLGPATSTAGEALAAPPITLTIAPPAVVARRPRRFFVWGGIGLSAVALGFYVQSEVTAPRPDVPGAKRLPMVTERVNVEPAPVVTRVDEPSWTVPDGAKLLPGEDGPQAAATGKAPVIAAGAKAGAKPAKAATQDPKSMPSPGPAEYDVAVARPVESAPQQPLAGGKVVAPAQPVDGAQLLASAMQKCGTEGFLSKFICEQKTYMEYCEDKWDKDPRCMRKIGER